MGSSSILAERIQRDVPLAGLTWFKLGGPAQYLVSPEDVEELRAALRWAREQQCPVRVLGGGANILVADGGVDGLVIRLDRRAFTDVRYEDERIQAGGGADLMTLCRTSAYRGLSGLECLAGIPGTVGGAVTMNAGGRFGQFADVVERVRLMDADGRIDDLPAAELGFGYRTSAVSGRIVLAATLRLHEKPVAEVVEQFLAVWRFKKRSQPMADHSAGCIFKNPPGDSAGRLIDQVGLKGAALGRARVSDVHANFIVADRGATAAEVLGLVHRVQNTVQEQTGTRLDLEIDVWSRGSGVDPYGI